MPSNMRSIIKELRFDAELREIEPNARRADEFIEGVELTLSRLPELGIQTASGSSVWCILSNDKPGVTPFIVFYTFDDDHVYLLSIRVTKPPEDE